MRDKDLVRELSLSSYPQYMGATMQVKLEGPGTVNLVGALTALFQAATDACIAYSQKTVKEMQKQDNDMTELHRRRQRLESEVKALEERKKKALTGQPSNPQKQMKSGTKPLTPEEQAAHRAKIEAERAARAEAKKAEAQAAREGPLRHQPFAALAAIEVKAKESEA